MRSTNAEHLVVLADEALRLARPHSRMCNGVIRRPPLSQATAEPLYPLPISRAPVPDAGEIFHLLRVQLTDVGRVDDDQRVLMDVTRAQTGDSVGNPCSMPSLPSIRLNLSSVSSSISGSSSARAIRLSFVLRRLSSQTMSPTNLPSGLENRGKFPQKILELLSRFERRCAMIHDGFPFRFLVFG